MQAEQAPLVPNKPPGRDASGEVWMIEGVGGGRWIYGMKSAREKKRAGEAKMSCVHTQPFLTFRGVGSWVANFFGITPPFVTRELVHKTSWHHSPRLCLWLSS